MSIQRKLINEIAQRVVDKLRMTESVDISRALNYSKLGDMSPESLHGYIKELSSAQRRYEKGNMTREDFTVKMIDILSNLHIEAFSIPLEDWEEKFTFIKIIENALDAYENA